MSHATVRLCKDTYAGIRNFIQLGLHPGSFGEALILRDRARAYDRAHATLQIGLPNNSRLDKPLPFDPTIHGFLKFTNDGIRMILLPSLTTTSKRYGTILVLSR